jgi:hypothetical protein
MMARENWRYDDGGHISYVFELTDVVREARRIALLRLVGLRWWIRHLGQPADEVELLLGELSDRLTPRW